MEFRYILILIFISLISCDKESIVEDKEPLIEELEEELPNIELEDDEVLFTDITKSKNGDIIEKAVVSIYAANKRFSDETDEYGRYEIIIQIDSFPKTGFIALNITHSEYKPVIISYEVPLIPKNKYNSGGLSQSMIQCPDCLEIKEENSSELFHLGDEMYNGRINSQFQKNTDGVELLFRFENSPEYTKLKLSFEAKGLESHLFDIPSSIKFGEEEIIYLERSPGDGSFANYLFEIENNKNYNSFYIQTVIDSAGFLSYDDWEFNALYLEGIK